MHHSNNFPILFFFLLSNEVLCQQRVLNKREKLKRIPVVTQKLETFLFIHMVLSCHQIYMCLCYIYIYILLSEFDIRVSYRFEPHISHYSRRNAPENVLSFGNQALSSFSSLSKPICYQPLHSCKSLFLCIP